MSHLMVDVDDVIFPLLDSIHERARRAGLHDGSAKIAWRGWESYRLPNGEPCPEQVFWDLWSEFALDGGYIHTPPIQEAAQALRWLHWEGHTIHLVTARGFMAHADDIRRWTQEWVEEFAIPHHTLTFERDKPAAQEALGVKFDFAIDDSPKNIAALTAAGVEAYLLDHEHNEADEEHRRVPDLWEWAYIIEKRSKA